MPSFTGQHFQLYAVAHVRDGLITHLVDGPFVNKADAEFQRDQRNEEHGGTKYEVVRVDGPAIYWERIEQ